MSVPKCPVCGKAPPKDGKSLPFCSERCRNADLSRWFNEEYSVPVATERALRESGDGPLSEDGENSGGSAS